MELNKFSYAKKIFCTAIWIFFSGTSFFYAYASTWAFSPDSCSDSVERIALFTVNRLTRGNISYLLNGRAITCRYADPFNCPVSANLEKFHREDLLVSESICQGFIGEIRVIHQLQTVDKKTIFYTHEQLKQWTLKANRYSNYMMFPLALIASVVLTVIGFIFIFSRGK